MEIEQWPAAAIATVVAALIAALVGAIAAAVGGIMAARRWRADERARRRAEFWQRISWGLDLVAHAGADRMLGLVVLDAVYEIPWVTAEDRLFTEHVLAVIKNRTEDPDGRPPHRDRADVDRTDRTEGPETSRDEGLA